MALSALVLSGCFGGSGGGSSSDSPGTPAPPEMKREHDERFFEPVEKPLTALPGATTYTGIYEGLQGEAVYAIEIPDGWDGDGLIMWAHGYAGTGPELPTSEPSLPWRIAVLAAGYAWASSSYSANYYDVRAGIEDTNKLALNITDYLLADYGVQLSEPSQYLISGGSLGGHVAAAAVDKENMERTLHKVPYKGAMPLCQAEQNQFQWLGDYPRVMQELGGFGDDDPSTFQELIGDFDPSGRIIVNPGVLVKALFNLKVNGMPDWSSPKNQQAQRLKDMAQIMTGGKRPIFDEGFASFYQDIVLSTGGSDGTLDGILAVNGYGNMDRVYRWTTDSTPTVDELEFNNSITRVKADDQANLVRDDGVRWLPLINGDFEVPVLTMHTLGDFYVPFRHQQLYRERAEANGNENLLVQRAIRAAGHCDFSAPEITTAIEDWLDWVNNANKPVGDEVLDATVVADSNYGCAHTQQERLGLPACSPM